MHKQLSSSSHNSKAANQPTTNLSSSKFSQQAFSMSYNQYCKKTFEQKI
jgi:hypothetical protein